MTQPHGGYRKPANPAPASGPGRLSRRTDGGQPMMNLPNADYGEQQTFRADQAGAPMSQMGSAPGGPQIAPADLSQVVPFGDPSQRPDEPVTAGANAGMGPGSGALALPTDDNDPGVQYLRNNLPTFELMANMPSSSAAFRQFVRRIRAAS